MSHDPHAALRDRALAALARRFPGAGIGVTGSVAAGRHHAGSDLDLLVADPAIVRSWQMALHDGGIRVNVLCVNPGHFAERLGVDATAFAAIRASYVLSARPLRDPHGHLAALQGEARFALALRQTGRGELLRRLHDTARTLLSRSAGHLDAWAAGAAWTAAAGAHLRAGRTALEKRDGNRTFEVLRAEDPELHALAASLLLGGAPVRETVERMIDHVFGDPPLP